MTSRSPPESVLPARRRRGDVRGARSRRRSISLGWYRRGRLVADAEVPGMTPTEPDDEPYTPEELAELESQAAQDDDYEQGRYDDER
jgi:hypothetical protein